MQYLPQPEANGKEKFMKYIQFIIVPVNKSHNLLGEITIFSTIDGEDTKNQIRTSGGLQYRKKMVE